MGPADDPALFHTLFIAHPDAVLLVDDGGCIVRSNPAAERLFGYAAGELDGLPVDTLLPERLRSRHATLRARFQQAAQARAMAGALDLVARRRDGSELSVEVALSPMPGALSGAGRPCVLAAVRDVAAYPRVLQARKRTRHAECLAQFGRSVVDTRDLAHLLQRAPAAAAAALDADQGVLYLLEPDSQHFRVAGQSGTVPAEPPGARVPNRPDTPPGCVLQHGQPVRAGAPEPPHPTLEVNGSAGFAQGFASALGVPLTDRGRVVGAMVLRAHRPVAFGDDEARFLESLAHLLATTVQRAQSDEALQHAQRLDSVGQLTGGIAHDFNNLLTVIQGNLQVLQDVPALADDALAAPMVAAAARAARRGADLTAQLLAFSRRQLLQPSRVDAVQLVQSLADMLRRTLDQRIRIDVEATPDCPPCLADAGQLESALLNLAINARDAMPDGGALRFTVAATPTLPPALAAERAASDDGSAPEAGAHVALAVTDTGTGMSEAVRQRAFEPFFTTKPAGRGTGLGLSTVYGFARQSHGGVTIDSQPGRGTTITLYLPCAPAHADAEAAVAAMAHGVPHGLHVLLVEDEPEVMRIARLFLAGWGCAVTECVRAEQALPLLDDPEKVIDLLLTDAALGTGLSGTDIGLRARAARPGLPVLLMSGYAPGLPLASAPPPGRFALLRKPFSRDELGAAIAGVIAASRSPGAGSTG